MYIWRRLTSGPGSPASPSSPLGPGVPLGPWRWKRHAGKTTDSTLHDVCGDEDAYRLTDVSTGPRMTLKKTEVECKVNCITFIVPQSSPPSHTWKPGHPAVPFPGIPTSPWNKGTDTFILAQTHGNQRLAIVEHLPPTLTVGPIWPLSPADPLTPLGPFGPWRMSGTASQETYDMWCVVCSKHLDLLRLVRDCSLSVCTCVSPPWNWLQVQVGLHPLCSQQRRPCQARPGKELTRVP